MSLTVLGSALEVLFNHVIWGNTRYTNGEARRDVQS